MPCFIFRDSSMNVNSDPTSVNRYVIWNNILKKIFRHVCDRYADIE